MLPGSSDLETSPKLQGEPGSSGGEILLGTNTEGGMHETPCPAHMGKESDETTSNILDRRL